MHKCGPSRGKRQGRAVRPSLGADVKHLHGGSVAKRGIAACGRDLRSCALSTNVPTAVPATTMVLSM